MVYICLTDLQRPRQHRPGDRGVPSIPAAQPRQGPAHDRHLRLRHHPRGHHRERQAQEGGVRRPAVPQAAAVRRRDYQSINRNVLRTAPCSVGVGLRRPPKIQHAT